VPDWPRLVAEICRVARRTAIVDYPDRRSFNAVQRVLFGLKKAIEKNTREFRCFGRKQLAREFAKHGFGRPAFLPEFFAPMVLHRALGSLPLARGLESTGRALGLTRCFGSPVVLRTERIEGAP
jgi:hypothetical protein